MIPATIEGVIRLRAGDVRPAIQRRLIKSLTFNNPEYMNRLRFGGHAEHVPHDVTFIQQIDGELILPRGASRLLREAAAAEGEQISWSDKRHSVEPLSLPMSLRLREYQAKAVAALFATQQGFVVVPCGGGKTVIGVAALCATGQPSLVIVHTRELLDQWREAFKSSTGYDAGTISEGKVYPRHFTVATVQTLSSMDPKDLRELGRTFGAVVVDELHHVPAATFQRVLPFFPAKFRFGLTATPDRTDGLSPMLELCIGAKVMQVQHKELVDAGHLIVPRVLPLRTGVLCETDSHTALISELVFDEDRNRALVRLVKREATLGRTVLVLSARVDHCQRLVARLGAADVEAVAMTSALSKTKRREAMDRFRSGALKVVCATSLADEGLDISRLERLVLATPARAESRTIQRLGRLMRPHPGKGTPVLYDLVDSDGLSQRQFKARQRAYRKVLGPTAVEDAQELA